MSIEIATIIAAFIGAFIGSLLAILGVALEQWLSHRFTESREIKKHYVESYQNLYAPILADVFSFLDTRTLVRRNHDVNKEEELKVYNKIIEHIGSHLIYASPNMITSYHQLKLSDMSNMAAFYPLSSFIRLMNIFFEEIDHIVTKSQLFSKYSKSQFNPLVKYKILYAIWGILLDNEWKNPAGHSAVEIMAGKYYFDDKRMTNKNYKKLIRLYKSHREVDILEFCARHFVTTNEGKEAFLKVDQKNIFGPMSDHYDA